jgi:hypothetical protein
MTEREKYTERYNAINAKINKLLEEREIWWARATKTTPSISDMPKGGEQPDKIQMAVEKIAEIDGEVNRCIDDLVKIKAAAMLKGIIIKER